MIIFLALKIAQSKAESYHSLQIAGRPQQAEKLLDQLAKEQFLKYPTIFEKGLQDIPFLQLELLSKPNIDSQDVLILIAGFTSEALEKRTLWNNLLQLLQSKYSKVIYSLNYHSSTELNFQRDLNRLKQGIGTFSILSIFNTLSDNQFTKANREARNVGKLLGLLLPQLFPDCEVQFFAYSLGTELVAKTLTQMQDQNSKGISMVKDVLFLGGNAEAKQIQSLAKDFRIVNFWIKDDAVLDKAKIFLAKMEQIVGQGEVEGVDNQDVSDIVPTHEQYHKWQAQLYQLAQQRLEHLINNQ